MVVTKYERSNPLLCTEKFVRLFLIAYGSALSANHFITSTTEKLPLLRNEGYDIIQIIVKQSHLYEKHRVVTKTTVFWFTGRK